MLTIKAGGELEHQAQSDAEAEDEGPVSGTLGERHSDGGPANNGGRLRHSCSDRCNSVTRLRFFLSRWLLTTFLLLVKTAIATRLLANALGTCWEPIGNLCQQTFPEFAESHSMSGENFGQLNP